MKASENASQASFPTTSSLLQFQQRVENLIDRSSKVLHEVLVLGVASVESCRADGASVRAYSDALLLRDATAETSRV